MVTTRSGARAGIALLAVTGLAALGACSGGSATGEDEKVTLVFNWWGDATRAERYEEAIALYEKQNPDVTIQSGYAAFGDYWTARNTEAASGSLPDVMQMDSTYLSQYAASGQIQPLDEYTAGQIDVASFPTTVMPATTVDEQVYGIPTSIGTLANFWNADVLDEIGVEAPEGDLTWEEYDALLSDIAEAGADQDPEVDGSTPYAQLIAVFEIWLNQQGKQLYTPEGEFGFDEADLTEWWERIEPMVADGAFIEPKRAEQSAGDNLGMKFTANEISWYNFLVRFAETSGSDFEMTLPPADDAENRGLYLKPSLMLSMSATTEHPEEAAKFMDFITNDPEVSKIFGTSRGLPISESALEALDDLEGLDKQILDYYDEVLEVVGTSPAPPPEGAGAVEAEFLRIASDVSYGATSVDDAVAEFFAGAPEMIVTD
ncbi:ABC transporter substrate-binding protein [Myceligenerans crystallogenes]|uniref:Extracellular solute-binding protein n=1 Tax=Myceligenerans crystallogenes TaxID=316335 RepID=A0ABN2N3I3_9MICO